MAGSKITRSHTSFIEEVAPLLRVAERLPLISKISLGIIKKVPRGQGIHRLKFRTIVGGLKITIRGTAVVQEIYVYTTEPDTVKDLLSETFYGKS